MSLTCNYPRSPTDSDIEAIALEGDGLRGGRGGEMERCGIGMSQCVYVDFFSSVSALEDEINEETYKLYLEDCLYKKIVIIKTRKNTNEIQTDKMGKNEAWSQPEYDPAVGRSAIGSDGRLQRKQRRSKIAEAGRERERGGDRL
ncbi:hypothetical protein SAY87_012764 [Trapa incisa]|uniref:Uncharacterized protein n=1 Tax=Trapa incisa TaxID=236973 RepID=A0AAN7JJN2_9MYRT|nr:hypothetical protein SAY87_012764 [Trapa incisa]